MISDTNPLLADMINKRACRGSLGSKELLVDVRESSQQPAKNSGKERNAAQIVGADPSSAEPPGENAAPTDIL